MIRRLAAKRHLRKLAEIREAIEMASDLTFSRTVYPDLADSVARFAYTTFSQNGKRAFLRTWNHHQQ